MTHKKQLGSFPEYDLEVRAVFYSANAIESSNTGYRWAARLVSLAAKITS